MAEVKWIGTSGQDQLNAVVSDGSNIYAGLYVSPAQVVKLDPVTLAPVGSPWVGAAGENYVTSLAFDGTYIYAGLDVSPGKVVQIDPTTMTTKAVWTGAVGEDSIYGVTAMGAFVYAACFTFPAHVRKITSATMISTASAWNGIAGQRGQRLTNDGTYIYHGVAVTSGGPKVFQINVTTMLTSATWTDAGDLGATPLALAWDGSTYLYVGLDTDPGKVIQITAATMAQRDTFTGSGGEDRALALVCDNHFIYAAFGTSPGKTEKLAEFDMSSAATWTGTVTEDTLAGVAFLTDVYMGCGTSPSSVIDVDPATMKTRGGGGTGPTAQGMIGARAIGSGII